ncbi:hypothetical protein GS688_07835 [Rhodococcus hoagii]|nr:hypothetical protein [Prescottella equi]
MSTAEQIIAKHQFMGTYCTGCEWDLHEVPENQHENLVLAHAAHVVAALTDAGKTIVDDARDEWQHRNASGGGTVHATRESAELAQAVWELDRDKHGVYGYFEPPMAPSVGIYRRTVTEWEPAAARVAEGGDQP